MEKNETAAEALEYLEKESKKSGIAAIKLSDSEIFMFTLEFLERAAKDIRAKGQDSAIVLVKTGPTFDEVKQVRKEDLN